MYIRTMCAARILNEPQQYNQSKHIQKGIIEI